MVTVVGALVLAQSLFLFHRRRQLRNRIERSVEATRRLHVE